MEIKVFASTIGAVLMLSIDQSWAVTLKLSHNQDKSHPVHRAIGPFAKKSKEYFNGDIAIHIYLNGMLDTQRETMELTRLGTIPLVETNMAEVEAFENSHKLFSLPCLLCDRDHHYQVMQGGIGRKILGSTGNKGYLGLTFYDGDARSFYGDKPILKPDDLEGMKIRVQPSPGTVEMIKVMGGNPTPLDYGELYTALQQGVIDMVENSVMALTTMCHGEMARSFNLDEHTMVLDVILVNDAAFDKLSPENQAVILKTAKESMDYMEDLWSEEEKQEFVELDEMGVKVYQVGKVPFIERVQSVYANFAKDNPALAPMLANIQAVR